jgi:hypothetical protein
MSFFFLIVQVERSVTLMTLGTIVQVLSTIPPNVKSLTILKSEKTWLLERSVSKVRSVSGKGSASTEFAKQRVLKLELAVGTKKDGELTVQNTALLANIASLTMKLVKHSTQLVINVHTTLELTVHLDQTVDMVGATDYILLKIGLI